MTLKKLFPFLFSKSYTLKMSNGYETSIRFPLTKELSSMYLNILESCPISLQIHTYDDYVKKYVTEAADKYEMTVNEFASKTASGQYVCGYKIEDWPNDFIFLKSRSNPHDLIATYFHELGHYKCNTYKCYHCEKHHMIDGGEHHAIMSELKLAMKFDFPKVMQSSFNKFERWLRSWKDYQRYQEYADAVLTLQSSKLWKKVRKYAKKNKIEVPTFLKPQEPKNKNDGKIKGFMAFLSNV